MSVTVECFPPTHAQRTRHYQPLGVEQEGVNPCPLSLPQPGYQSSNHQVFPIKKKPGLHGNGSMGVLDASEMHEQSIHTVDGKTPGEPVEVGSYPTIYKGFVLCRWLVGISSINSSMHTELLTNLFWNGSFSIPNCNSSTCPMKFVQNSSGNMSKPRRRPTMILTQRVQSACVLAGPVCWKY